MWLGARRGVSQASTGRSHTPPAPSAGAGDLRVAPAGNPPLHTHTGALPAPAAVPQALTHSEAWDGGWGSGSPCLPQHLKPSPAWLDQSEEQPEGDTAAPARPDKVGNSRGVGEMEYSLC